jgi:hypothetical protein
MAFGLGSSQVIFTFVYVIVRSVLRLLVVPFHWELPLKPDLAHGLGLAADASL